jgi:prepilin-type N-terminal cleavage/methylation domain-containing protein
MPLWDHDLETSRKGGHRGFSLVELLMVAAIMLIIATFALPNFIRTRYTANETSAVSSLRILYGAETQYASNYNSFSADLNSLGPPPIGALPSATDADLVDGVLSGQISGQPLQFQKSGYLFIYTPVGTFPSAQQYTFQANPLVRGNTGQHSFFMDQTGIVRSNGSAAATVSDSPIS